MIGFLVMSFFITKRRYTTLYLATMAFLVFLNVQYISKEFYFDQFSFRFKCVSRIYLNYYKTKTSRELNHLSYFQFSSSASITASPPKSTVELALYVPKSYGR